MNAMRVWGFAAVVLGCAGQSAPNVSEPQSPDVDIARIVQDEADALRQRGATRVGIVVLDPASGRVVTSGDVDAEVPMGSTVKPFTIAAALEAGLDPERRFPGHDGRWRDAEEVELVDWQARDTLDARDVIAHSSNVGAGQIVEAVGSAVVESMFTKIGVNGRAESWPARGAGVDAYTTPLRLAGAYAAFANGGFVVEPGTETRQRVMSEATAAAVVDMLETAVGDVGTGHRARVEGHRVAGKTGTARPGVAVFAGLAPLDTPQWVVVVRAEAPNAYGGSVAAPAFARIVTKLLR